MYTCQGNQQMEKIQTTISNILMTISLKRQAAAAATRPPTAAMALTGTAAAAA